MCPVESLVRQQFLWPAAPEPRGVQYVDAAVGDYSLSLLPAYLRCGVGTLQGRMSRPGGRGWLRLVEESPDSTERGGG